MMDFTTFSNNVKAFAALGTADQTVVDAKVAEAIKAQQDIQDARTKAITGLAKNAGITEEEAEKLFGACLAPKVDMTAYEATTRAAIQVEEDAKANETFWTNANKMMKFQDAYAEIEHQRELEKIQVQAQVQPKTSVDKLVDLMLVEKAMSMNNNYAPAPTPVAPTPVAPTPVSSAPTPTTITTRKELGNELRSISASARGDRAMIHADSVIHPFTGNCKKWGASLFQEIADRAYTCSDYWKNK